MPRGQPDYGPQAVKEVTASVSDMGEVAARLGSIVTYDKRGVVVDFDNFETPAWRWQRAMSVGGYVLQDSTNPKSGSQAARLYTAAVIGRSCGIYKDTASLVSKRLGSEISFSRLSHDGKFTTNMSHFDGEDAYYPEIYIDSNTGKIYLWDNTLAYREIADEGQLLVEYFYYYTMKMVCDFTLGKYVRLMFMSKEYDISAYTMETAGAPAIPPHTRIELELESVNAVVNNCWLDDWVFTQDEP